MVVCILLYGLISIVFSFALTKMACINASLQVTVLASSSCLQFTARTQCLHQSKQHQQNPLLDQHYACPRDAHAAG